MNILVIDGHPDLTKSVANSTILNQLSAQTNWTIKHAAQFDGELTQQHSALLDADAIVIQFPLYWSTYPAVLKHWVDEVFTYGFAFGPQGSQLKDKPVLFSITAGATEESYSETGFNFLPFSAYQAAYEHPFKAAEMNIVDTIITFEMNSTPEEGGDKSLVLDLSKQHANQIIQAVNQLAEVAQ